MNTIVDLAPLQAHLDAIKARTLAWVAESPKTRWACYPVDEAAFWAEQGITTVEQFERDSLEGMVREQHKDVYGFKPHHSLAGLSMAALKAMSEDLSRAFDANKAETAAARVARKLAASKAKAAAMADAVPVALPQAHSGFTVAELVPALA